MASLTDGLEQTKQAREHLEKLIQNPELLGPDFAPVLRLEDRSVVGWQAVGRGVDDSQFTDRAAFLRNARALGLAERLDWAFRCRILDVAAETGATEPIHLKVAFAAYGTVPPPRLAVAFGRGRTRPVVVEVHEAAYDDATTLATGLGEFRKWNWEVAVGDLSERTDSGSLLQRIRPSIVRVDLSRPGRSTEDSVKRYVDSARRQGLEVLATGLDTPLRVNEAELLGATMGLGRALGEPVALPS